jgi:hypothetical protein
MGVIDWIRRLPQMRGVTSVKLAGADNWFLCGQEKGKIGERIAG